MAVEAKPSRYHVAAASVMGPGQPDQELEALRQAGQETNIRERTGQSGPKSNLPSPSDGEVGRDDADDQRKFRRKAQPARSATWQ